MTAEVDQLRQQIDDLAGRVIADHALLRQVVLMGSTPQLRSTHALVEKLSEDGSTQGQFRTLPHASRKAFDDRRKQWLTAIDQELASRQAAMPMN